MLEVGNFPDHAQRPERNDAVEADEAFNKGMDEARDAMLDWYATPWYQRDFED